MKLATQDDERDTIWIENDRLAEYQTLQVNYTTYDGRRCAGTRLTRTLAPTSWY